MSRWLGMQAASQAFGPLILSGHTRDPVLGPRGKKWLASAPELGSRVVHRVPGDLASVCTPWLFLLLRFLLGWDIYNMNCVIWAVFKRAVTGTRSVHNVVQPSPLFPNIASPKQKVRTVKQQLPPPFLSSWPSLVCFLSLNVLILDSSYLWAHRICLVCHSSLRLGPGAHRSSLTPHPCPTETLGSSSLLDTEVVLSWGLS